MSELEHIPATGAPPERAPSLTGRSVDDVIYTAPRHANRCVKDTMRIVRGDTSATPSPFFARAERLGLLFTLNRKQALIYQRLEGEQTSLDEVPELQKMIQFLGFVTSGVVAETQRVDEALLETKEEAIRIGREIKILDTKLQSLKRTPQSSLAERAIAEHFPSRIITRQSQAKKASTRGAVIPENLKEEAESICEQINSFRQYLQNLGEKIRVLTTLQAQMHGTHRLKGNMSGAEIQTLVDEISLPGALRRAIHLIRDLTHSGGSKALPEELEEIPAIKILREFLHFVDAGVTTILDDLFRADLRLKKAAAIQDITNETVRMQAEMERSRHEKQLAIENVGNTMDATLFGPSGAVLETQSQARGASQASSAGLPSRTATSAVTGTTGGGPGLPPLPSNVSQHSQQQQQQYQQSAPNSGRRSQQPQQSGGSVLQRSGDVELQKFLSDFCA